jgi:DNA-binding NtrC family response regulator
LHGPLHGVTGAEDILLRQGRYVLGRETDEGGICVDDPRASRTHATLHVASRAQKVRLSDEDSRHGTWVNGSRIDEAWLNDGDIVRIGDTHFLLRFLSPKAEDADVDGLLGRSPATCALRRAIKQVAPHDVTVMVIGESGTGKEVVARAIHEHSGRTGPFVAINCAAIVEQLAESQLFGHVAGAFTGATAHHTGFFRAAHGGTVFLDEIGDLQPALQPKLLRALEEHEVVPVGATKPEMFDARVIVATHQDLADQVEKNRFRGDLFARLAQFQIDVAPLRTRREDVLLLLRHALEGVDNAFDPELVDALLRYDWPFNVRELFAVAGELRVRRNGDEPLLPELIEHRLGGHEGPSAPASSVGDSSTRIESPSREQFEQLVVDHKGNVRALARATGRSRMQVYRWVEQFGLDLAQFRDS